MNRAYVGIVILSAVLSLNCVATEKPHYFAAEDLADDCVSHDLERQNECFGVMYGVIGSLGFLGFSHSQFADVLCLPAMSAVTVKDEFLSAFYAHRNEFTGMLAGASVASVLYDHYPCAAEKTRREQEAKSAVKKLEQEITPK